MAQTCTRCSRVNPARPPSATSTASPSGHGGAAPSPSAPQRVLQPVRLPLRPARAAASTNWPCACQQNWPTARELLAAGYLESFLGGLGRVDLALAAREAARFPDPDRGLDQFLDKLPTEVLEPPQLQVEPQEINLGQCPVGQDRRFDLRLENQGMRLLVRLDDLRRRRPGWPSATPGPEKLFQFTSEPIIPVHVARPAACGPAPSRWKAGSSSSPTAATSPCSVTRRGAGRAVPRRRAGRRQSRGRSPRRPRPPRRRRPLLENGAVAALVQGQRLDLPGPGAVGVGLGAVQQFFEALGLTRRPRWRSASGSSPSRATPASAAAPAGGQGPGEAAGLGPGVQRPALAGGRPHHP